MMSWPSTVCTASRGRAQLAGRRIFIFGCARSGTTLLQNLLRTFADVDVWDGEHCINTLGSYPAARTLAAKRTSMCAEHLLSEMEYYIEVPVLDIIRDPRDVVTSRLGLAGRFHCDFARWRRDVHVGLELARAHPVYVQICYEDLVLDPDRVQQELMRWLGLTVERPFSSFMDAVPANLSDVTQRALGGVRPVETFRIGRWMSDHLQRERVRVQLDRYPDMEVMLRAAGYSPTLELRD